MIDLDLTQVTDNFGVIGVLVYLIAKEWLESARRSKEKLCEIKNMVEDIHDKICGDEDD